MKIKISIIIILIFSLISCYKDPKGRVTLEKGAFDVFLGEWKGEYNYFNRDFKKVKTVKISHMIIKINAEEYEAKGTLIYENGAERELKSEYKIKNNLIMKMKMEETSVQKVLGSLRDNAFVWMYSKGNDFRILREKIDKNRRILTGYEIISGKVHFIKAKLIKQ